MEVREGEGLLVGDDFVSVLVLGEWLLGVEGVVGGREVMGRDFREEGRVHARVGEDQEEGCADCCCGCVGACYAVFIVFYLLLEGGGFK